MADKKQFGLVLNLTFACALFLYIAIAVVGYTTYGRDLLSQITLSMPTTSLGICCTARCASTTL